jgi:hypothetical protein
LPPISKSSLELSSHDSQGLIKHNPEQSTDCASLSTVLPKGNKEIMATYIAYCNHSSDIISDMYYNNMYSGDIKLRHLNIIKWTDEDGQLQQFNLTKKIAHKWRTIAKLTYSMLKRRDDEHRYPFKEKCCKAILELWLDNPPPDYPATWQGLMDLLEDSELGEVATELRTVLSKVVDL